MAGSNDRQKIERPAMLVCAPEATTAASVTLIVYGHCRRLRRGRHQLLGVAHAHEWVVPYLVDLITHVQVRIARGIGVTALTNLLPAANGTRDSLLARLN